MDGAVKQPHIRSDRMPHRSLWPAAAFAGALLLALPVLAADTASAVLKDPDGKEVGKAVLMTTPSGTLITLELTATPPGAHGFHIHTVGKCEPPKFESAEGHFNPDNTEHGFLNAEGPHAGDMPNIHVPESGKLTVEVLNPLVTLSAESALLDEDGSALMLHADPDDYKSDPAGHAGGRIACGVIAP
jgi:superoxide dismutase, Cu-Zn family